MNPLPGCFYPTEVVFVDDSEIYLRTLGLFFENNPNGIIFKTFCNADDALNYINQKSDKTSNSFWEHEDTFSPNCYALKLNVFSLHEQIYNSQRHNQISVVIADYDLGHQQKNGIDFCKKIKDKNIHKILFTEQTDHNFVIDAFNAGIINQYVQKQKVNSLEDVLAIVHEAQKKYFVNRTEFINVALQPQPNAPLAIYSTEFIKYFKQLLQKNSIEEYYLLDAVGSSLLIDKQHNISVYVVQSEDERNANYLEQKDELSQTETEHLKSGEIIYYNSKFWNNQAKVNQGFLKADCIEDSVLKVKFFCGLLNTPLWIDKDQVKFFQP